MFTKASFLSGWNFMRIARLVMGIAITIQGIMTNQYLFIFLGALLAAMPLFNIGCCGNASCQVPSTNRREAETSYEEVK